MSQIDSQPYNFDSIDQLGSYPSGFHRQQLQQPNRIDPLNSYSRTLDYLNYAHNIQIHRSSDNKFIDNRVPDLALKKKYRQPYLESTPLKPYAEYLSASPRSYETSLPPVYYDPLPPSQYNTQPREVVYHRAGDIQPIYSPTYIERQSPYQTYHNHPQYNGYPIISSNQYGIVLDNYSNLPREYCGICPPQDYVDFRQNYGQVDWEAERRKTNLMLTGREDGNIKNTREVEDKQKVQWVNGGREVTEYLQGGREVGDQKGQREIGQLKNVREVGELRGGSKLGALNVEREEITRNEEQDMPDYENTKYMINKDKGGLKVINKKFSVIEEEDEIFQKPGRQIDQKNEGIQTDEDIEANNGENLSDVLENQKNTETFDWRALFIRQQQNIKNFYTTLALQDQPTDQLEEERKIQQISETMKDLTKEVKENQNTAQISQIQRFIDSQMNSIRQDIFNNGFNSLQNKVIQWK